MKGLLGKRNIEGLGSERREEQFITKHREVRVHD
jgi:hypothetical protein